MPGFLWIIAGVINEQSADRTIPLQIAEPKEAIDTVFTALVSKLGGKVSHRQSALCINESDSQVRSFAEAKPRRFSEVPPPSIYLAAKLRVTDLLDDRPKTIEQLATATNTEPRSLYRLLRALASIGIFTEVSEQCFALTPLGATLQSHSPESMRYVAMAQMGEDHSLGWSNELHSLRTGETAFDAATGMSAWDYYARHPEAGQVFSQSMTSLFTSVSQAVAATYDFSQFKTIVDVGGSQGSLISAIVRSYPHLKGILFDLPEVIATVNVDDRIQPIAGNFFESVPSGGDAYLMRAIIHDWDDEKSLLILKNCHQDMQDRGKLLLVESILPPSNEPSLGKFVDVIMLMMTGGRESSEDEYRSLLQASGFELTRVIPTPSMLSIIEAVKR
ncbi:methyltransferase [Chroococcidiopsis sp. FACHB-1243]|uniref:methyltransferase n=1 Tax=Chroococcidiopsis sp. [FACHB-1243] TaxID=2692781 RepID=UPI001782B6F5|nr:methyltransferase [Chroococcidiopsis sp. [FACHB-1243]]MBD2310032.1 methyltransferase [Chroococcidiopsis sp. [FACHB-1243]]